MTMLLMQDVLKGMHTSTLKERLLFMAASYSADSEEWSQVVKQQVTSDQFAQELTHSLLLELHSAVAAKQVTGDVIKVLDLISHAVTVAAAQHEVQTLQRKLQAELTKQQYVRCGRHVTQQQASYDRDGCAAYKHTGTLKQTSVRSKTPHATGSCKDSTVLSYTCCHSTVEQGCTKDRRMSHIVAEAFN
jgi:hypothetical protein